MTSPQEVYPFATQDGKAIPFDVLYPLGYMLLSATTTPEAVTLADVYHLATFMASQDSIICFSSEAPSVITPGAVLTDALFLPKGFIVTAKILSSTWSYRTLSGSGSIQVQIIEKWAGLALDKQFNRKF